MKKTYKLLLILSCLYLPCSSQHFDFDIFDFDINEKEGKTLIELKFSKSKEKIYFWKRDVYKEDSSSFSVKKYALRGDTVFLGNTMVYLDKSQRVTALRSCYKCTYVVELTRLLLVKNKYFRKIKPKDRVRLAFPKEENVSFIVFAFFKKKRRSFEINTFVIDLKNPKRKHIKLVNHRPKYTVDF